MVANGGTAATFARILRGDSSREYRWVPSAHPPTQAIKPNAEWKEQRVGTERGPEAVSVSGLGLKKAE